MTLNDINVKEGWEQKRKLYTVSSQLYFVCWDVVSQVAEEILDHIDIIDVISKYVPLKRSGANFSGCCPFHNEKTPSFMVSPSKQIFKCFGCGKWGNAISFVQEIERIDFWDAIKELAKQGNVDISKYQGEKWNDQAYTDGKEKIKRLHKLAQQYFLAQYEASPLAQQYLLHDRKLDSATISTFGIGYAPDSHYELLQHLRAKGFSDADLIEASLAKKGQTGEAYAFFKHRITFPIYDIMNNVVGFSARIINPQDKPKYLNSSEHKAFEKSKLLYGLNIVKQHIKQHNHIIIVEGQMDVIALHRLELPIGVATCGTALTTEHLKLIKRYTENVYLLFDNDSAGQEATIRALNVAYQNNVFPKVIHIPKEYKDMDELANIPQGKEILQQSFSAAQDGFVSTFQTLKASKDFSSPIEKQQILNTLFGLIQNINNVSLQQHYIQALADITHSPYEYLDRQYRNYCKNEGKFTRPREKKEVSYQIDRVIMATALFYENFIEQYVQDPQLWEALRSLVSKIAQLLPESPFGQALNPQVDDEQKKEIESMQLRWDKELNDGKDEKRKYATILQTIRQVIHLAIQTISKNRNISGEDKQSILQLTRKMEEIT